HSGQHLLGTELLEALLERDQLALRDVQACDLLAGHDNARAALRAALGAWLDRRQAPLAAEFRGILVRRGQLAVGAATMGARFALVVEPLAPPLAADVEAPAARRLGVRSRGRLLLRLLAGLGSRFWGLVVEDVQRQPFDHAGPSSLGVPIV